MRRALLLACVALTACARNSGIVQMGPDTYYVSKQAATGFSGAASLKAELMQQAGAFCSKDGRTVNVVRAEESKPPYLLGNFPRAELQFECLQRTKPSPGVRMTPA
jgi:hypothetical protein